MSTSADVLDGDGIWNVAQVLRLATLETVEVTYDCWGAEYNEVLRRDSDRIAPYHTHTWLVKCWAKLDTWPWWPAVLTVRTPGSAIGAQNLRREERLLVDFLDHTEFLERCRFVGLRYFILLEDLLWAGGSWNLYFDGYTGT